MLLTALTYDASQQELSLLIVIGGLTALLVVLNLATQIWDRFRKKPSSSDELACFRQEAQKTFATKSELTVAEARLSKILSDAQDERRESMKRVEKDVTDLRHMLDQGFKDTQRTLGRLEGKLENCPRASCKP